MTWWCKKPEHELQWYWLDLARIFWIGLTNSQSPVWARVIAQISDDIFSVGIWKMKFNPFHFDEYNKKKTSVMGSYDNFSEVNKLNDSRV